MKFVKTALAVFVFNTVIVSWASAASIGYVQTIDGTNTVIGVRGEDESVKTYELDQIDVNKNHIISLETDLNNTKDGVLVVNDKVDDVQRQANLQAGQIASNNSQIGMLFNAKAAQDNVNLDLQDTNNKQDKEITDLQNVAKVPGPKGDKGDTGNKGDTGQAGVNGKDGMTTTVTKVDTETQKQVANNTKSIASTAKQSADVAKDLRDAQQFFNQQQAGSNAQFSSLKDEVEDNKKEARSGAASAIAIASMPQVEADQTMMFSAGVGTFKNEQALSVGASFHAGSRAIIKAGVSDSTNNDFAMGAGVGIGF